MASLNVTQTKGLSSCALLATVALQTCCDRPQLSKKKTRTPVAGTYSSKVPAVTVPESGCHLFISPSPRFRVRVSYVEGS